MRLNLLIQVLKGISRKKKKKILKKENQRKRSKKKAVTGAGQGNKTQHFHRGTRYRRQSQDGRKVPQERRQSQGDAPLPRS